MRLGRAIISALLAFWMPLCCCQIGAIAGTGAPCCAPGQDSAARRASNPSQDGDQSCCAPKPTAAPACCARPQPSKGADPALPGSTAGDGCCDAQPSSPEGEQCTCCSTKAPAPTQESIDDLLPLHRTTCAVDSWTALALIDGADAACIAADHGPPPLHLSGGLPWPAARQSDRCAQLSIRTT